MNRLLKTLTAACFLASALAMTATASVPCCMYNTAQLVELGIFEMASFLALGTFCLVVADRAETTAKEEG